MNRWFVAVSALQHRQDVEDSRNFLLKEISSRFGHEAELPRDFAVFQSVDWSRRQIYFFFTPSAAKLCSPLLEKMKAEPCIAPLRDETMTLIIGQNQNWGLVR